MLLGTIMDCQRLAIQQMKDGPVMMIFMMVGRGVVEFGHVRDGETIDRLAPGPTTAGGIEE